MTDNTVRKMWHGAKDITTYGLFGVTLVVGIVAGYAFARWNEVPINAVFAAGRFVGCVESSNSNAVNLMLDHESRQKWSFPSNSTSLNVLLIERFSHFTNENDWSIFSHSQAEVVLRPARELPVLGLTLVNEDGWRVKDRFLQIVGWDY